MTSSASRKGTVLMTASRSHCSSRVRLSMRIRFDQAGPPNWHAGISLPLSLSSSFDPGAEAVAAIASVSDAVDRDPCNVETVDGVFTVVQLAFDDRCFESTAQGEPSDTNVLRSALAQGALGLVTRLTSGLQPRKDETVAEMRKIRAAGGGHATQEAVVSAARHLSAMEQHVASQNNTSALLIAHNGLARLLKSRWPWLIDGVLDATRLLSHLCSIYRDGLVQLNFALAKADRGDSRVDAPETTADSNKGSSSTVPSRPPPSSPSGLDGADVAHLKKFGKLLATFGTRISCLLKYLGPECPLAERHQAYRLFAQALGAVYPGMDYVRALEDRSHVGDGNGPAASVAGVVARAVFPRAVEAFLSTIETPPFCGSGSETVGRKMGRDVAATMPATGTCDTSHRGANGGKAAIATSRDDDLRPDARSAKRARNVAEEEKPSHPCRCYDGKGSVEPVGSAAGKTNAPRRHNPCDALEALRFEFPLSPGGAASAASSPRDMSADHLSPVDGDAVDKEIGDLDAVGLGSVLLLCRALRSEARVSDEVDAKLRESCGWVTGYLGKLFVGWLEAASTLCESDAGKDEVGACEKDLDVATALSGEVSSALGTYVTGRARRGDVEEAQIQLLEGCACHPHPLCREVWCDALRVFLHGCNDEAQAAVLQTFADAALDPRVSPRCRRRIARALFLVGSCGRKIADSPCAGEDSDQDRTFGALSPTAVNRLRRRCLSRLLSKTTGLRVDESGEKKDSSEIQEGGTFDPGMSACALDLIRRVPWLTVTATKPNRASAGRGEVVSGTRLATAGALVARGWLASSSFARSSGAPLAGARGDVGGGREGFMGGDGPGGAVESMGDCAAAARLLASVPRSREGHVSPERRGSEIRDHALLEAARDVGVILGRAVRSGRKAEVGKLCEVAPAPILRLVAAADAGSLPQLCSWLTEGASKRRGAGETLLALAEGLRDVTRQPLLGTEVNAGARERTLIDGFAALFAATAWPVTTAAMQAVESMARHADPRTARLLPRVVPGNRLSAFKARLARRMVTVEGKRPAELAGNVRERGALEWRILAAAAAASASATAMQASERVDVTGAVGHQRQVVLREGSDLSALVGLLDKTILCIETLGEGRGVCITLKM